MASLFFKSKKRVGSNFNNFQVYLNNYIKRDEEDQFEYNSTRSNSDPDSYAFENKAYLSLRPDDLTDTIDNTANSSNNNNNNNNNRSFKKSSSNPFLNKMDSKTSGSITQVEGVSIEIK